MQIWVVYRCLKLVIWLALTQPVLVQFLESLLSVLLLQQNLWGPFNGALAIWLLYWLFCDSLVMFQHEVCIRPFQWSGAVWTVSCIFAEVCIGCLHWSRAVWRGFWISAFSLGLQSMDLASTVEQGCLMVTWKAELPHDVKEKSLWSTSSFCFIRPSSAWEVQETRKNKKS